MQTYYSRIAALALAAVLGAGAAVVQNVLAQPPAGAVPEGFTALFNGEDLTGWRGPAPDLRKIAAMTDEEIAEARAGADASMHAHWRVVDGVLEFDGQGESLRTERDYGNFELYVDWKIPPAGDSGIYLRGNPQVQIWDATHEPLFKHGADKGSGGLWNNKEHGRFPLVLADKPVGEWNTFFIRMVGDRVSVKLNGQPVVDDVPLENYWEPGGPLPVTGGIELQNHGNKLWFRNIYIRELPEEASQSSGVTPPKDTQ